MKKKSFWAWMIMAGFSLMVLVSCASTPIENLYPERWEQTKIGMSLDEFKQVWPEAKYNGVDLQLAEVWTVSKLGMAGSSKIEYFTFQDGKLVKFHGN